MIKKIFLSILLCTVCLFTMAQSPTVTHVVQRGETIESIAEHYNVSVEDINKANPNMDGVVYVGMKLNIPAARSIQTKEPETESTSIKEDGQVSNRVSSSKSSYASQENTNEENETALGFQFTRAKFSLLFPTELEKSTRGHYKSRYVLSFVCECEYVFNPNVFAGIGLGFMGQGSCNSDQYYSEERSVRYQQYESSFTYLMLPLSIGYRMPVAKNVNFDIYTGPSVTYVLTGYYKERANTSEEWNKTKLKDMEDVKYFTPYWTVGARVKLWSFEFGAEYWYLMTKTNWGGSKRAIAAYFALHI